MPDQQRKNFKQLAESIEDITRKVLMPIKRWYQENKGFQKFGLQVFIRAPGHSHSVSGVQIVMVVSISSHL